MRLRVSGPHRRVIRTTRCAEVVAGVAQHCRNNRHFSCVQQAVAAGRMACARIAIRRCDIEVHAAQCCIHVETDGRASICRGRCRGKCRNQQIIRLDSMPIRRGKTGCSEKCYRGFSMHRREQQTNWRHVTFFYLM